MANIVAYTTDQIDLIKRTIAKGATDDELAFFLHQCRRTGLDPFSKQIYAIKRRAQNDQGQWVDAITVQTGIDGYRLIAERTERYVPGREPTYTFDTNGLLVSATSYVKKLAGDQWHEIGRTAFYAEYVQTRKDGEPTKFWKQMPCLMLAKCAEALALRAAFPQELSGVYTDTEMAEVEVVPDAPKLAQIEHKPEASPANRQGNGNGAKSAPVNGHELLAALEAYDAVLVKRKLIPPGALVKHVHHAFTPKFGVMDQWDRATIEAAMAEAKAFHENAVADKEARDRDGAGHAA